MSLYLTPLSSLSQTAATNPPQISQDASRIQDIITQIACARSGDVESIISFKWEASTVDRLFEVLQDELSKLNQPKIRRVEFDFSSDTAYLDTMGESILHAQVQEGVRDHIHNCLMTLSDHAPRDHPEVEDLIKSIRFFGQAAIKLNRKLLKQPDGGFGPGGDIPPLVYEVS